MRLTIKSWTIGCGILSVVLGSAAASAWAQGTLAEDSPPPAEASDSGSAPAEVEREAVTWVNPLREDIVQPGLSHHVMASEAIGEDVGYVVWLPEAYEAEPTRRFGVIYFLHGFGNNEAGAGRRFPAVVADLVVKGAIEPVIVVCPNGGRSGYAGEVESMIINELIPLIDREYRTIAATASRGVAGFSMGGMGSVRLSLRHPELFGAAVSFGGGFRRGGEEAEQWLRDAAPTLKANGFALRSYNGDEDHPDAYADLYGVAKQVGLDYRHRVLTGTSHKVARYMELAGPVAVGFLANHLDLRDRPAEDGDTTAEDGDR